MYRFDSKGEMGAPCGTPRFSSFARVVRVRPIRPLSSSTGATSHCLSSASMCRSLTRRATDFISGACGMLSKYPDRSASTTSSWPCVTSQWTCRTASCARRFARYAYCSGCRSASKIGSRTSTAAVCTTRSRIVGMPSGLRPPFAFGIHTRRTGAAR